MRALSILPGKLLTLLASLALCGAAVAQSYPDKQIRLVLGFAAGGPTDIIARHIAKDLSDIFKQSVVVENKTGASGNIATDFVGGSAADGYTLLFTAHTHLTNEILMDKLRYNPIRDFAPISEVCILPLLLLTEAASPMNSVADFVQAAKVSPGILSYASAGIGSSGHLGGALFEMLSGTKMTHVPFRGNANAIVEVMAGRVTTVFYPMIGVADMVKQKQVKVLVSGTPRRLPDFPNVPTMAEVGYPGFVDTVPWLGVLAPAGTPAAIVERVNAAIHQSLNKPETRDRLRDLGAVIVTNTPAEFKTFLEKDSERWARLIKAAGVKGG